MLTLTEIVKYLFIIRMENKFRRYFKAKHYTKCYFNVHWNKMFAIYIYIYNH